MKQFEPKKPAESFETFKAGLLDGERLTLPVFARVDEYCGLWSIPADHFAGLVRAFKLEGWQAHLANAPEPAALVERASAGNGKTVAVVRLTGVLMKGRSSIGGTSTIEARREIRTAAADPDVSAIMLAIDSPGGTVAGTFELAEEVRAARRAKPVYAHVEDLCASAAFWVASQAERITANSPTALIGSIGTYQVVYDESASLEAEGVKTFLFATGPLKGLGTPGVPVSENQAAHLQSLVDSVQASFDTAVRKGRSLSADELAGVRHGGVLAAPAALDAKLIDAIQPLPKSLSELSRATSADSRRAALAANSFPTIKYAGLPVLSVPGESK